MFQYVCKRLLENPEESSLEVPIDFYLLRIEHNFTFDPGPLLKFLRLPLDCRCKTEMIQIGYSIDSTCYNM